VQIPLQTFKKSATILVEWALTVPHPADVLDTGVRIALHFSPQDSFERNILAGGLEGDPNFGDRDGDGRIDGAISAGPIDAVQGDKVSLIVDLPNNKTCNYCTLQFVWAARSDGGYYVSCSDISITNTGLEPIYAQLPPEAGRELPSGAGSTNEEGVVQVPIGQPGDGGDGGGGGNTAVIVVVVLLVLAGVGGGIYWYSKQSGGSGGGGKYAGGPPPPTPSGPPPGPPGNSALPPGWTSVPDQASGRTYYVGPNGETSWEFPNAAPGPGGGLPPGWSTATDPSTGNTYYVNSNGQTSWEKPMF